jgi:hypothetical protein
MVTDKHLRWIGTEEGAAADWLKYYAEEPKP